MGTPLRTQCVLRDPLGCEGRNAFQRPKAEAIQLLHAVMDVFAKA